MLAGIASAQHNIVQAVRSFILISPERNRGLGAGPNTAAHRQANTGQAFIRSGEARRDVDTVNRWISTVRGIRWLIPAIH
jgi:hypothetical protein